MNGFAGFSLYELITVLAIVVILTNLALPSFAKYTLHQKSFVTYLQLRELIQFARSEALRQNALVHICSANYSTNHALSGCRTTQSNDWSQGALVYIDYSGNGSYNHNERLKALQFTNSVTVNSSSGELVVKPDSSISDASAEHHWVFQFSQTIFRQTFRATVEVGEFGYAHYCPSSSSQC